MFYEKTFDVASNRKYIHLEQIESAHFFIPLIDSSNIKRANNTTKKYLVLNTQSCSTGICDDVLPLSSISLRKLLTAFRKTLHLKCLIGF